MPTTIEMTTEILSGEGFAHRTWARYERGEPDPGPSGNERVEAIVRFLPTIQSLAELPADASYEDLQYVLIQLADDLAGEYENPALGPLWNELRASTAPVELSTVTWGLGDDRHRYAEPRHRR